MNEVSILKSYVDGDITKIIFECNDKIDFKHDGKKLSTKFTNLTDSIRVASIKGEFDNLDIYLKNELVKNINPNDYKLGFGFNSISSVGIRFVKFTGVKRPLFVVEGSSLVKNAEFKVYADGKEIDFTNAVYADPQLFTIKAELPSGTKTVSFSIVIEGEEIPILNVKNRVYKRIKHKVKEKLSPLLAKILLFFKVMIRGIKFLWKEHHFLVPPRLWGKYAKRLLYRLHNPNDAFYNPFRTEDYNKWLAMQNEESEKHELKYKPLISVLIPVYNVDANLLNECVESILNQSYENFEICLVDDASTREETKEALKELEKRDKRIKVKYREKNGHISRATNDALAMAKGEFIALVDNDDVITENALYENVLVLNENKNIDFIYSDEDKLDLKGNRCHPHFKPDYSPDTLMSSNYICHFSVLRKSVVEKVGGFEVGLEGAQDYDLFLKVTEVTDKIYHIPKVLYHWRMIEGSTSMSMDNKSYASDKGMQALENALKRRKIKASVRKDPVSVYYIIDYDLEKEPLVSIIIPTRDYADTLDTCLKSVYEKTKYKNYEVIAVNNNSKEEETFKLFDEYKSKHKNFKVIDANFEFNYSKINNLAVKQSKGEYICLLNNDTEIISPDWLTTLVGYASQKHAGAVGPKLLYPDDTVQHAGVILGLGGVAAHAFSNASRDDVGVYGRLRVPYNYGAVTAACLVVKKSKYLEVNGLEEDLKVAYNDVDFNIKLLKKGYYNICTPQVMLYHFESKSRGLDTTSEKYKRFQKESKYMHDKWDSILLNDPFYNKSYSLNSWFVLDKKSSREGSKK